MDKISTFSDFGRVQAETLEVTTCGECGQTIHKKRAKNLSTGEPMEFYTRCYCDDYAISTGILQENRKRSFTRRLEVFNRDSLVHTELEQATFKNFVAQTDTQQQILDYAKEYARNFSVESSRNLLIHGQPGRGKSHLLYCIAKNVSARGFSSLFIDTPMLLTRIQEAQNFNSDTSTSELLTMLQDLDLLALDDVLAENMTGATRQKFYQVINARQGKPTITTSNYGINDMIHAIGERDASRIVNGGVDVEMDGPNHRFTKK